MYKRCEPPFREKWTSASHDLVTCGKKCWTSTKALPAAIARTHWTASCVRLVKPPLLPNAARANVVHQALLAIQAKTAKMVTPELMASQADQVKMPNPMITSFQCHPNATATLHQAAQANQDPKDPTAAQATLDPQALMVNQAQLDHQARPVQPANQALTDPKDPTANQEFKKKAPQAQQANQVHQEPQALQDQLAQPVVQAKTAALVPQAVQETPDQTVPTANQEPQALQETMVPQVPLALALTAHQLVWLQAIKNSIHRNCNTALSRTSSAFFCISFFCNQYTKISL
jgi:hypothetical protein